LPLPFREKAARAKSKNVKAIFLLGSALTRGATGEEDTPYPLKVKILVASAASGNPAPFGAGALTRSYKKQPYLRVVFY